MMRISSVLSEHCIRWGFVFALPIIPLIVTPSIFFPYVSGKVFFFFFIIQIAIIPWIFLGVAGRWKRSPWHHPLFLPLSALLAITFVSDVVGVNFLKSFWSTIERSEGFILYAHLYVLFLIAVSVLRREDWVDFFKISVGVSILVALHMFGEKLGLVEAANRVPFSTIGNTAYAASYLFLSIFFCLYLTLTVESKLQRWIFIVAIPVLLLAFFLTGIRGAYIGFLFFALFICGGLVLMSTHRSIKIVCALACLFFLGVPSAVFFFRHSQFIQSIPFLRRYAPLSLMGGTVQSRALVWGIAIDALKERPILGWGQENFIIPYAKYYRPALYGNEPWFDRPHNTYLQWIVDTGVVGFMAFAWIIVAACVALWKLPFRDVIGSRVRIAFFGFGLGYAVQNFFIFDTLVTYVPIVVLLGFVGLVRADHNRSERVGEGLWQQRHLYALLSVIILTPFVVSIFRKTIIQPLLVTREITSAYMSFNQGDMVSVKKKFETIFEYGNLRGVSEAREQFSNIVAKLARIVTDKQWTYVNSYIETLKQQIELDIVQDPLNVRTIIILGRLLTLQYLHDAIDFSTVAQTYELMYALAPGYLPGRFDAANFFLMARRPDKIHEIADAVFIFGNEAPYLYHEAVRLYAMSRAYDRSFSTIAAMKRLDQVYGIDDAIESAQFALLYNDGVEAKQFLEPVILHSSEGIDNNKRSRALFLLASAEKILGNIDQAIHYAQQSLSLSVEQRDEISAFIDLLQKTAPRHTKS